MIGYFDNWVVTDSFWATLNAIFGALLGASFYVLVKTHHWLRRIWPSPAPDPPRICKPP